jgi:hypothetical protein
MPVFNHRFLAYSGYKQSDRQRNVDKEMYYHPDQITFTSALLDLHQYSKTTAAPATAYGHDLSRTSSTIPRVTDT